MISDSAVRVPGCQNYTNALGSCAKLMTLKILLDTVMLRPKRFLCLPGYPSS